MSSSPNNKRPIITPGHRPTWAEIDLDALAANFQIVRRRVGSAVKVMAVVKANAYGHGAIECAHRLATEGADWFGVALPEEGIELRAARLTQPILCLSGFWEGQQSACIQHNLVPVVYRVDMIEALDQAALTAGVVADVHVKIDTGMGRLGVRFDQAREFAAALKRFKNIRVDGLMTHLAAADDPSCEPLTSHQIQRYEEAVEVFRERDYNPTYHHLANSAGIFDQPSAWGNMVRPGGVLYGLWRDILPPVRTGSGSERVETSNDRAETSSDLVGGGYNLKPVMSVRSRITLLKWVPQGETIGYGCTFEASRKTLIATLPVGYDDGYMRGLSNRAHVIVRGTYAPVVGRVSMDFILIDLTNVEAAEVGDKVTLIGEEGELKIPAEDLAKIAGTLSYEVTSGISERVPRLYV